MTSEPRAGLWESPWSALQGLASNVLSGETGWSGKTSTFSGKRPRAISDQRAPTSVPPSRWGPAGLAISGIGTGSREEREALVREAKRKALLAANGHRLPDSSGRFKRRTSDDYTSVSIPPAEQEDQDALVYIHRVQQSDTMAGVTIRFNCQPAVLRKANRMWPNDPVQARKIIYLPVDVCGAKGRKVASPESEAQQKDLLGDDETITMHESPSSPKASGPNGWHSRSNSAPHADFNPPSSRASSSDGCESPWKHDSWVILPNETSPVEIARLPRKHLGFFPRARRKSNTFSDIATPTTMSLDLPRNAANTASGSRSPRTSSQTRSASSSAFVAMLQGPGGVGTLDRHVRIPGPAPDSLNRILGPHLPSVAPPPSQTVFTTWNPGLGIGDDSEDLISFGMASGTIEAPSKNSMDLQEIGGAVETWMRKMAKKAANALEASSTNTSTRAGPALAGLESRGGDSDLIELVDAFDTDDEATLRSVPMESSFGSSSLMLGSGSDDGMRGRRKARDDTTKGKGD